MPLDPDSIAQQQALLAAYRRTLAQLLIQQAQFSAGHIPAHVANGIAEARANITRIKAYLRENGVPVEDELNDDAADATSPAATEAERQTVEPRDLDAILKMYINQIEALLVAKNLLKSQTGDEVRVVARIRILTALRRLDGEHNQTLIQFLRDAGLLVGQPTPIIDLRGANLKKAALSGVDLSETDLRDANLEAADLRDADLGGANLQGAKLRGAYLQRADLRQADLQEAGLIGTNLTGADLTVANLRGAMLIEANLQGAELMGANLQGAELMGATMPDGSKHE